MDKLRAVKRDLRNARPCVGQGGRHDSLTCFNAPHAGVHVGKFFVVVVRLAFWRGIGRWHDDGFLLDFQGFTKPKQSIHSLFELDQKVVVEHGRFRVFVHSLGVVVIDFKVGEDYPP